MTLRHRAAPQARMMYESRTDETEWEPTSAKRVSSRAGQENYRRLKAGVVDEVRSLDGVRFRRRES